MIHLELCSEKIKVKGIDLMSSAKKDPKDRQSKKKYF